MGVRRDDGCVARDDSLFLLPRVYGRGAVSLTGAVHSSAAGMLVRPDFSDLRRIARASCPYERSGNYVKGKGRARRPNVENCWPG